MVELLRRRFGFVVSEPHVYWGRGKGTATKPKVWEKHSWMILRGMYRCFNVAGSFCEGSNSLSCALFGLVIEEAPKMTPKKAVFSDIAYLFILNS